MAVDPKIAERNKMMKERWDRVASEPYSPVQGAGANLQDNAAVRIAHALEYIAAQLGQINAKLSIIAGEKPKPG